MQNLNIARIRELLKETMEMEGDIDTVSPDEDLTNIGMNSVSFIQVIVAFEEEFEIQFEEEDLDIEHFRTINSILEFLKTKTN
ncbi:phosphopantetheine-binding protein [Ruminiclostridium cellulolyticum]|uniref:Phosphopantetheine-binding n=1 Tax=Ruminiclostridium cellulolyticum (strain ATCC 35319 / DSM 5812 / JCM 6584 / H10) TaxID=394503 RepID=B8I987_RUMCH|nr:phosphopantetheine-binding protein [Ruminiclostridium cellulolyticum]ACL75347.1 phosphopantetheine-binding [Ruminiclostridium cellulolyticum H10]